MSVKMGEFGVIQFDENCMAEVSSKDADALVEKYDDLSLSGKAEKPVAEEPAEEKVEEPVAEEKSEEPGTDYSELTKSQLREVAAEANLPKEDWSRLTKSKLLEYLESKV